MKNLQFSFTPSLPKEMSSIIEKGHVKDEQEKGVVCNFEPFAIILKDGDIFIGALQAYTAYAEIYVDDIWVKKEYRGKGFGKKLLDELEKKFEGKGYNNINLVTSAFQAKEFYLKCGFEIEFERINQANPKLSKTFFIKFFKNASQSKGIL